MADELILDGPPPVGAIKLKDALERALHRICALHHQGARAPRCARRAENRARRLLFAMRQLRLDPDTGFKKCARVVAGVIGKYHPHGDQSVYDTLKFVSN